MEVAERSRSRLGAQECFRLWFCQTLRHALGGRGPGLPVRWPRLGGELSRLFHGGLASGVRLRVDNLGRRVGVALIYRIYSFPIPVLETLLCGFHPAEGFCKRSCWPPKKRGRGQPMSEPLQEKQRPSIAGDRATYVSKVGGSPGSLSLPVREIDHPSGLGTKSVWFYGLGGLPDSCLYWPTPHSC